MLSPDLYRSAYPGPGEGDKRETHPGVRAFGVDSGAGGAGCVRLASMTRKAAAGIYAGELGDFDSTRGLKSRAAGVQRGQSALDVAASFGGWLAGMSR